MRKVDYILERCCLFAKKAGLLSYPPKMKDNILSIIDRNFQKYKIDNRNNVYNERIPINLEGMPESYHIEKLSEVYPSIEFAMQIIDPNYKTDMSGFWVPEEQMLALYVVDINGDYDKIRIEDIVEHELSHMVQFLLSEAITSGRIKAKPGYPSQWRPTETVESDTKKYQELGSVYYGSGIEFFPHLRNAISRVLHLKSLNKYSVTHFMYSDQFMVSLRLHKPKQFERAVSEIWKAVQDKLDNDPIKEAESKESFENWKFVSDNKLKIINFAIQNGFNRLIPASECPQFIKDAIDKLFKMYNIPYENLESVKFSENKPNNAVDVAAIADGETIELIMLKKPT